jgi:hypothetical protein
MNDSLELQASLEKLGRLLLARAPARRAEGASILNALAVQLETRPSPEVVEALLCALTAVLDEASVNSRQDAELAAEIAKILSLCRNDRARSDEYERVDPGEEPAVSYSLGPRALELTSLLRFQAGMAVDYIHLILTRYLGFGIPLPDLQKIVLTLPPSVKLPQCRQSRARR